MKCSIDSKTREIIFLDNDECFGVEFDKKTQKLEFSCHKIVGDNLDLSQCTCRINYMNAKGYRDSYLIEDILVDGDDVTFTWTLSSKVTAGRGICSFIFCARQVNENGVIEKEWNTTVAKASIKRGLETNSYIEEEHSDILESILSKIDKLENTEVVTSKDWFENDTNSPKYIENRPGGYYVYEEEEIGSCNDRITEINKKYRVYLHAGIKFENEEITLNSALRIYNFDEETGEPLDYNDTCVSSNTLNLVDTKTQHVQTGPSSWDDITTYYYECETDWYKIYREYTAIPRNNMINDIYYVEFTIEVENMNNGLFLLLRTVKKLKPIPNIANGNFIINIDIDYNLSNDSIIVYDIDKTFVEIKSAVKSGMCVQIVVLDSNSSRKSTGYSAIIYGMTEGTIFLKIELPKNDPEQATEKYNIVTIDGDDKYKIYGPYYTLCLKTPKNNVDRHNLLKFNTSSGSNPYYYSCMFADPNIDYMTPSMGITKPNSSLPQIAAGDVLSVSSLSSGVPSKWKTTKVDSTVTADSTNLVTSGAVYAAIQEAIANLNNTGE